MPAPPSRSQQAARDAAVARSNASTASAVSRGTGGFGRTDRAPSAPSQGGFGGDRTDRAPASRDTGRAPQTASRDMGLAGLQDRTQQRKESAFRTDRQPSAPRVGEQRVGQAPQIPTPRQNPLSDISKFNYAPGRSRSYTFSGNTDIDEPGVMSQEAISRLVDMQERYGGTLTLTSGFRGPNLNAPKALGGVGGAKESQHLQGKAFDIHTGSTSKEDYSRLAQAAGLAGFKGFGAYKRGSMHVDLGPARSWGPKENEVMAAIGDKTPMAPRTASKSPFAPPSAQAAVASGIVKPRRKPQQAATLAQARELRKAASVSLLRRDPMEGVAQAAPRKMQDRVPLGPGRLAAPKDQSRLPVDTGIHTVPDVRSRSPFALARPEQRVTGPGTRTALPSAAFKAPQRAAVVQGVRPAVVGKNVFSKQPAKAPASNQLGVSPGALPSLARMAVSGVKALTDFRAPNLLGALNEAASYVKQFAEAQPGLGVTRTIAQRIVAGEARKAIAAAKRAVAGWQRGTLTKVAAAEALQAAQKAVVQVARAPHGLVSNELRAKITANEKAPETKVASIGQLGVAPRRAVSAPVRSPAMSPKQRGRDTRDRSREERKSARRVAQVAKARPENPFLFPIGPSYPTS